jgi:3-isopropylmalate/(R)-2-methylmalate dehydratase small subunit
VDTDRIIPARYLSRVSRSGYGELLFADVRGSEFALDQPEAAGATILVVGTNFGCGSSREHAVWAIQQAGFRAVIGRLEQETAGFSDIFRGNAANCGLLLIELSPIDHIILTQSGSGMEVEIDLPAQTLSVEDQVLTFEMNGAAKLALIEGLDLIGTTLRFENEIQEFEKNHEVFIRQQTRVESS